MKKLTTEEWLLFTLGVVVGLLIGLALVYYVFISWLQEPMAGDRDYSGYGAFSGARYK